MCDNGGKGNWCEVRRLLLVAEAVEAVEAVECFDKR